VANAVVLLAVLNRALELLDVLMSGTQVKSV